ncbi:hypothetical protein RHMOL_Rhmol02G0259600 [Rhododendron molle]|uniref:Uncharacterized protein n=1 Tax=Rhododendron molle TaxID=49168 RepID=A0ACC0PVL2_RHOML|nr:hypothetical protein RHMOL_Rhmol02G0259600 [Rhododendron molle]
MDPPTSWDSLRKQARKLEAQLDEQMPLYRKVVSKKVDDGTDKDLESGIDELLQQLHQVNSHMQAWVSSGGSEIFSHTLTRHQEILQDLTQIEILQNQENGMSQPSALKKLYSLKPISCSSEQILIAKLEFNRLRSSLRAKKEHASLLEDFREFDRTRLDMEDGGGSYEQALLKEHAAVSRSTGQMDSVISQAQETLRTLAFQRSTFGGINSKISNISSRLPTTECHKGSQKRSPDQIKIYYCTWHLLRQFDFSGESNPLINKEEKVHGHYNPFLSCLCLHISHFDLLVEQIVDVAGLVMKSRDSLPSTILLANTLLVCQ